MANSGMLIDDALDRGLQISAEHNVVDLCAHIASIDEELSGLTENPADQTAKTKLLSTRADSLLALRMIAKQFDSEDDSPLGTACSQLFTLMAQLQEVEKQYIDINHDASPTTWDHLKSHWDTLTAQVSTSENGLVRLINSDDAANSEYLHLQKDIIQNQQCVLRDQRKHLNAHLGKIVYTPTRHSKRSKTDAEDMADTTQNLLQAVTEAGGLSRHNVNAVE